jgi:hypothetical protein
MIMSLPPPASAIWRGLRRPVARHWSTMCRTVLVEVSQVGCAKTVENWSDTVQANKLIFSKSVFLKRCLCSATLSSGSKTQQQQQQTTDSSDSFPRPRSSASDAFRFGFKNEELRNSDPAVRQLLSLVNSSNMERLKVEKAAAIAEFQPRPYDTGSPQSQGIVLSIHIPNLEKWENLYCFLNLLDLLITTESTG